MKIAFDIGGLISRYPDQMIDVIACLRFSGVECFILTDMNPKDAKLACKENNLRVFFDDKHILSADWSKHGDRCKSILMAEHGIDILIDDRPDYCAEGSFIGLVLSPRPGVPYYHPTWVNRLTPAVMVPPEEYEAFQAWRKEKGNAGQTDQSR